MFQVARRTWKTEEGKDDKPKKNTCPHCKKSRCKKPHQVEPSKCMWNKKYKGYRFKSICNKLEVAIKPRHKFSAKLGGYASKDNKSRDNQRCVGMPKDGENNNDKWITVKGNSKTKNYSTPNQNLNCIMHLPYSPNPTPSPTTTCQALHSKWMMTKPSYPLAHESTSGSKKLPGASTSNKHFDGYAKVTICSSTMASPTPRTNTPPSPRTTPTMQGMWQSILPMHNATNQPSRIRPTAWVPCSIQP
jgi:hypothetical protein